MTAAHHPVLIRFRVWCLLSGCLVLTNSFTWSQTVKRVPIVIHNIYDSNTQTKAFADNSVAYEQLNILNAGFRYTMTPLYCGNPQGGVDTYVEFFLATHDKDGNPSTGIVIDTTAMDTIDVQCPTCYTTELNQWIAKWPIDRYINIIVHRLYRYGNLKRGWCDAGFVVWVDYRYFGRHPGTPFWNEGHVTVHEVGHWLSLTHYGWIGSTTPPPCDCGSEPNCNFMSYMRDSCTSQFNASQATAINDYLASGKPNAIYGAEVFANRKLSDSTDLGDSLTVWDVKVKSNTAATVPLNIQFLGKTNKEILNG